MSGKQCLVCLLALAGSAGVFLITQSNAHDSLRPRIPAGIVLQAQNQKYPAKIVPRSVDFSSAGVKTAKSIAASFDHTSTATMKNSAIALPMSFEPNVGQADSRVEFIGQGRGLTVLLAREEIAVRVAKSTSVQAEAANRGAGRSERGGVVTLRMAGGLGFSWKGEEKLRGESNYFIGKDPRAWRTQVPHFAQAESASAARGVSLSIYGNEEGVEYDLRVAPGTDVAKLRLAIAGAQDVHLDGAGNLVMNVGGDELKMKRPAIYEEVQDKWHSSSKTTHHRVRGASRAKKYSPRRTQKTPGGKVRTQDRRPKATAKPCASRTRLDVPCPRKTIPRKQNGTSTSRKTIDGGYVIEADGTVGFRVGPYDAGATLVIDPSLSVAYGTFLGGTGSDSAASVALDASGKIYVGGTTTSATTFPEWPGNRAGPADGPAELFIAKIDPTVHGANSLVFLTFIGGSGIQAGGLIAVDASGRTAITGTTTATDYPVTDASQPTSALASGYGNDVIVSEIDPTGSKLVFSTLFGGSGTQSQGGVGGIALDSLGDVYIASDTHTTPIDSNSTDLPVTAGAFQATWDGQNDDGFLAIFQPPPAPGGTAILKYCSYLGTNSVGLPGVGGIAVDVSGNAYIAGSTSNGVSGFPTKNAIQTVYGGGTSDAFLMKISPGGLGALDVVYATLIGGSGADEANAVGIDTAMSPNAYVTGTTKSTNFPTNGATGAYQTTLHANATSNAFLSVVAENAISGQTSLSYSTYVGGSVADAGQGVAVTASNSVYVTGATASWDFPWRDNLQPFNGAGDAFLAKFDPTSPGAGSLIYLTPLGGTSPLGGTASATGNGVAADGSGHVYVAGSTTSADFPTAVTTSNAANGFQVTCASCQQSPPAADAFVNEIAENAAQAPSVYFNTGKAIFPAVPVGTANAPQLVAVLNGGEANLTISDIEISGAKAADFSLIGQSVCYGKTISPGPAPQCSFEVGFTPSVVGPEAAVVTVSDNAPGSPQILELTGGGQGPLAAITPLSVDFGNQPENSTSQAQTITMTNVGNQNLVIVGVNEGGADAMKFSLYTGGSPDSPLCQYGVSLSPGDSCVVQVTFAPNATRTFHAEVDFIDNSGHMINAEQAVQLTGVGTVTSPIVSLTVSAMNFPNQAVGGVSGPQSVTLTNQGSAALSLTSIAVTGTNAGDFEIDPSGTTCPTGSGTLSINASCTVAVRLAPQSGGPKSANLSFTDNAAAAPQQVTLSGTATTPPTLTVSPGSLSFAPQSEGTTSASQIVTISNMGSGAAGINGITLTGANAEDFVLGNPCAPSLASGASCQISVSFSPAAATAPGIRSATLDVPTGTPQTVAFTGTAVQAAISLPTSFIFATQLAGTSGSAQPVTVTNSSTGPYAGALAIASVTKGGTNPGDFAVTTDSCIGASTPPGGTCSIQISFAPTQSATCGAGGGARSATLILNDNAPGSPHSVPLSATAMDFCIDAASGQPVSGPISAGQQATYLLEIDSSMGFTGTVGLACSGAPSLGTSAITTTPPTAPTSVQVSAGAPGQFEVIVTTAAAGAVGANETGPRTRRLPPGARGVMWLAILLGAILMAWAACIPKPGASSPGSRHPNFLTLAQSCALLVALSIGIAACGGAGGGTAADPPAGTPPGTYVVTVTATVGSVVRTIPLSITVD